MSLSEQLLHIGSSLSGIYPELFLVAFFLLAIIFQLAMPARHQESPVVLIGLHGAGAVVFLGLLLYQQHTGAEGLLFEHMLESSANATFFKILIALAWIAALFHIAIARYRFLPEFSLLMASAVVGASLLCLSANLLMVYLSIELISLSSYLLVALSPKAKASEGGLKYLLFGGISSAIMLYGISFVYGLTGTLDLGPDMWPQLSEAPPVVLATTSLLLLGGLLFKLSLIPFHIWTPDTYQAAPTPIVSFLSAVPKIAVLLALARIVFALPAPALPLLGGIALISMTIGNVGALWQRNARRLMAYSTIAQAGYLITGLLVTGDAGLRAATFYLIAYVLLSMSAFLLIDLFAPQTETDLEGFSGKGKKWVSGGIAVTIVMVGLAGLPPTVGFTGKWLVFSVMWSSYAENGETWRLILLAGGILNAAISLAYYLKIPYLLFFKNPVPDPDKTAAPQMLAYPIVAVSIIAITLLLFFKPEWVLHWI